MRDVVPTVVFSHGYTLSLRSWVFQRRALTAAGYRVVVWDQRGHGRSGTGSKESANIDQLGRDLARVIAEAAPEGPLVLVGHSMGGMTMMSLAVDHHALIRERVVAAAFIATSPGSLDEVSWGFGADARQGACTGSGPSRSRSGVPAGAGHLGPQGRQGRRGLLRRPLLLRLAGAAEHRAADGGHDLRHPHGGHGRSSW